MKISKNYLKQIIKEEIRSVLYNNKDDSLEINIIHAFTDAIHDMNEKILIKNLKSFNINPVSAINYLNPEAVDADFYNNACEIHNSMVRLLGRGEEKRIDAFSHFPEVNHDPNKDPDPNFMRSPKLDRAYDQEDPRDGKKNWVH